jgi:hypothetical protein
MQPNREFRAGKLLKKVARDGIEPPTPAFSGLRSPDRRHRRRVSVHPALSVEIRETLQRLCEANQRILETRTSGTWPISCTALTPGRTAISSAQIVMRTYHDVFSARLEKKTGKPTVIKRQRNTVFGSQGTKT